MLLVRNYEFKPLYLNALIEIISLFVLYLCMTVDLLLT